MTNDPSKNDTNLPNLEAAAPDLYRACDLLTQAVEQLMPKRGAVRHLAEVVLFGGKAAMAKAEGKVS